MSRTPNGDAPRGYEPTGDVSAQPSLPVYIGFLTSGVGSAAAYAAHSSPHAFKRCGFGGALPHGYFRPSLPRAAYSHSGSVGSRAPMNEQYEVACVKSTQLIG